MLSKKLEEALNNQINAELYSSYLYLSMAAWLESQNLTGFSNWMKVQNEEELFHVMKFFEFVNNRSGRVILEAIDGPPTDWESPLEVFKDALDHEKKVSDNINKLVRIAREESDYAAENFLQWFVSEQVEEESSVDEVVQKLKLVGSEGAGLFMIDQELAKRVFNPPASA